MEQYPDFSDAAFCSGDGIDPVLLQTTPTDNEDGKPFLRPRKRPMFNLFEDFDELDEPSNWSDLISWPSHQEEDDVATELLSVPSVDNIVLSRTTSLDNALAHAHIAMPTSLCRVGSNASATRVFRIPDNAKAILDSWFGVNINDPYLKPGDAAALAHLTGLTEQQVKTYMANRRIRKLGGDTPRQDSTASLQSLPSTSSPHRRRGRRRFRTSSDCLAAKSGPQPDRIYHCTSAGCSSAFSRKGDWKRHGATAHLPQEEWVCMLTPPALPPDASGVGLCAFCEAWPASDEHLEDAHRVSVCAVRPEPDRAFARKDKLAQHLAQVHGVGLVTPYMAQAWMRPVNRDVTFLCGFCGEQLEGWGPRCDHVAAHFEDGMTIEMWRDVEVEGPLVDFLRDADNESVLLEGTR